MNKKIAAALAAALVLPVAAEAAETNFSYTYGELAYTDMDANGASADGIGLEGSYQFMEQVFGFASYEDLSGDYDFTTMMVGVGFAHPLSANVDGIAKVAFVDNDAGIADDTGFGLELGLRAMVASQVEVFGSYQYLDIYEDSTNGFELGGRFWFQDNFGVSLAYNDIEDADGFTLAARYNF